MDVRVQKYGGSSLRDTACIHQLADILAAAHRDGQPRVVVVSAMGDTTDRLLDLARELVPRPQGRELDALLSTAECVSAALVALALQHRGVPVCALTGAEAGIVTDAAHNDAEIVRVDPNPVRSRLDAGQVVVVAGFQGVAEDSGCVTTLGRGGSDTTAVALAAALDAAICELGTDVDGVYTADPRYVSDARKLERIAYGPMLELAKAGAKVLIPRCIEYAMAHEVPLRVHTAAGRGGGTWITSDPGTAGHADADSDCAPLVWGAVHTDGHREYTVAGLPDCPDAIATVFGRLSAAAEGLDMETWGISRVGTNRVDLTLTLPRQESAVVAAALTELQAACGFTWGSADVGKLVVVGSGLQSNPAVLSHLSRALSTAGIAVRSTRLTEGRIALTCPESQIVRALVVAHDRLRLAGRHAGRPRLLRGDAPLDLHASDGIPSHRT